MTKPVHDKRFPRTRATTTLALTAALLLAGPVVAEASSLPGFGSSGSGSAAVDTPETPRLASVNNFRDIAGTGAGYEGLGGLHVNRGVFYRSNTLAPTPADLQTLGSLGLTAVYDLRTDQEIAANPDVLPDGVRYQQIQVLSADPSGDIAGLRSPEEARAYVEAGYRDTVTDETSRRGYALLLTQLANTSGPQVFHCTAGKDRTGWATALLLGIAGVPRQTIVDDYLLSNECSAETIRATLDRITATKGPEAAEIYRQLIGVDAGYLEASFDELERTYGSFDRYLTEGLGLTIGTVTELRLKLLA
ncbi:tyrosine-protein phosphatase [Rhodococcus hoagii]|uniref:tyrosine-protein phosphatase n=1 Tax=Rhodococcus hoagii TaxID=43767 RepID=UPI0019639B3D|nr:tyrosine-protein phosphatase [Prescottella equi]MBM9835923.1 tyrosine-protein phosphatase [Prescottella equi]